MLLKLWEKKLKKPVTQIGTKLKTQIVTKVKNTNCDQTKKNRKLEKFNNSNWDEA